MTAYCTPEDLLVGTLPISDLIDQITFVDDAADEIDAAIGEIYVVPVDLTATGLSHHAKVLLKKINSHLATGRLIATLAIGAEDTSVHAYAVSMINDAMNLLNRVANGQIKLVGAERVATSMTSGTGPAISNADARSSVDAFSDFTMRPFIGGVEPLVGPRWAPGPVSNA